MPIETDSVPDCSFAGCSHCGVCSIDFGHNIVVPPPPIPQFAGQFTPNQARQQRLRVWFGKQGDLALVSHLDLVRLFDRAVRRAALPISFTGGFHPGPRISPASALALGATSSGEIVDFELTQVMAPEEFCAKLAAQLPADLPLYQIEAVPQQSPATSQLLERSEYVVTISSEEAIDSIQWKIWVDAILDTTEVWFEQTTKSGKRRQVNLRERLFELEYLGILGPDPEEAKLASPARLRYIGSCLQDGTILRPEHLLFMFEQVAGQELQLQQIHRNQLILRQI